MTNGAVFVGVLRSPRDLSILLHAGWYRIPADRAPVRNFRYLAFYQPASFGKDSGKILYYAAVRGSRSATRLELLPDEPGHPGAGKRYLCFYTAPPRKLARPVRNAGRERLSCGYTTLKRLRTARDIHELFGAPQLERVLGAKLRRAGLAAAPEHAVMEKGRCRYRLDFALFGAAGKLDIECDGKKWHSRAEVKKKDALRDAWLAERGWDVLRLPESEILEGGDEAVARVRRAARPLRA